MVNETFDQSTLAEVPSSDSPGLPQEERRVRRDRVHGRVPHLGLRVAVLELPRQDTSTLSLLASLAILTVSVRKS